MWTSLGKGLHRASSPGISVWSCSPTRIKKLKVALLKWSLQMEMGAGRRKWHFSFTSTEFQNPGPRWILSYYPVPSLVLWLVHQAAERLGSHSDRKEETEVWGGSNRVQRLLGGKHSACKSPQKTDLGNQRMENSPWQLKDNLGASEREAGSN